MRKDMFELIIERPRWGRGVPPGKGRYATRMKADPEAAPLKEGMKFRGRTRELSENFAPLRRFLARRVGRPWDAVWSEIRAHLSPSSAVQKHVFDHVLQFVERCVFSVEERSVTAEEVVVDVAVEDCVVSSAHQMVRLGHGTSYARAGPNPALGCSEA